MLRWEEDWNGDHQSCLLCKLLFAIQTHLLSPSPLCSGSAVPASPWLVQLQSKDEEELSQQPWWVLDFRGMQHLCFLDLVNPYLWSGQKLWCFFPKQGCLMHRVEPFLHKWIWYLPSSFQRKEGDDGLQKRQWQRICVDDFDFASPKELIWPVFGCRTQTGGLSHCTSAFRLGGFRKAVCCGTLPGSAFNLATTRGWRQASLPSKRGS